MKKVLIWILFIVVLTVSACSKASTQKALLEGTWGLVHYESTSMNGGTQKTESEDLDPYNPSSRNDGKIAFLNTQGDTMLMTFYSWDLTAKDWIVEFKFSVEYQNGKLYYLQTKRALEIKSLDAKQLVLEMPQYSGMEETATITGRTRMVLRKMQNI